MRTGKHVAATVLKARIACRLLNNHCPSDMYLTLLQHLIEKGRPIRLSFALNEIHVYVQVYLPKVARAASLKPDWLLVDAKTPELIRVWWLAGALARRA